MFSRRWTVLVLVGWLLLTGRFLLRDLSPRFLADEPAAFTIAIGDEPRLSLTGAARFRQTRVPWMLTRNGREFVPGNYDSVIQYNQWNDTLEFYNEFKLRSANPQRLGNPWLEVESIFRADWEGRLLDFDIDMRLRREPLLLNHPSLIGFLMGAWLPCLTEHLPEWPLLHRRPFPHVAQYPLGLWAGAWLPTLYHWVADWPVMFLPPAAATVPDWSMWTRDPFALRSSFASNGRTRGSARTLRSSALPALSLYTDQEVFARCRGQVRDGQFLPLWRITGEQRENVFNPVVLSRRGHVLLLFHPLNRLPGLRTGQRWVMPLIDPEAALRLERSREIRNVLALVTEAEPLLWDKKMQPVFLVTLSDAEGEVGRIWVRQTDFLVLRQEFTFSNDRYALERSTTETPR